VHRWSQFNAGMVSALKAAGLNVCGWQYVYGNRPIAEANVAAAAKRAGADCFVIDAESEYQGRYVAADRYMRRLRALVGASYPIGLAPFPYVDFHPSFPYSVFLGPGRAQYDQPQMYWFSIGTSVDTNYAHTYTWHRLYKRPIFPLGESYGRTPTAQIRRFRQLAQAYSAGGVSWWEWTQTRDAAWQALAVPLVALTGYQLRLRYPRLGTRSRGDPVVWAQEHLWAAGYQVPIDGRYAAVTRRAVLAFQAARGLPQTGLVDDATWTALLRHTPVSVRWVAAGKRVRAVVAQAAARSRTVVAPTPASAALPPRAREIPPKPHGRG
jgi:Putative peptidoglycan binding domain